MLLVARIVFAEVLVNLPVAQAPTEPSPVPCEERHDDEQNGDDGERPGRAPTPLRRNLLRRLRAATHVVVVLFHQARRGTRVQREG